MGKGVLTPPGTPFPRVDGRLTCAHADLEELALRFETPLFVYDAARIRQRMDVLERAFAGLDPLVAFSVKSNPNIHVLRLLVEAGAGADIVSGGELVRALEAGCPPERIVFAGVGKTRREMEMGLEAGIKAFHVESRGELELLARVAEGLGACAPVGVRVNLDIESPTHEYTRTGHRSAKFGVAPELVAPLFALARDHPALDPVGLDVHIGSQIRDIGPFIQATEGALDLAGRIKIECDVDLQYLDLGGGYGVSNGVAPDMDVEALGARVSAVLQASGLGLVVEPGRFLVGDAGCLLTTVLYVKQAGDKTFVVTDAGMTELIRPSHYGGHHPIAPVVDQGRPGVVVDVVGPVCETGDFLARDRELPLPEPGELLWVGAAGAYGFAMASNYNSRPRPAEVLVDDGEVRLIRRRETLRDLYRNELEL